MLAGRTINEDDNENTRTWLSSTKPCQGVLGNQNPSAGTGPGPIRNAGTYEIVGGLKHPLRDLGLIQPGHVLHPEAQTAPSISGFQSDSLCRRNSLEQDLGAGAPANMLCRKKALAKLIQTW